jgi:branched-chain amino acid transport system permease protein
LIGVFGVYYDSVLTGAGINVLAALGLYFTVATGQFSVGHGAFMAIGAYTASILTMNFDLPLLPAVALGGLAAFVVGVVVGLPVLRFSHLYLAMATLGFGEIVRSILSTIEYVGGVGGMRGMTGTNVYVVMGAVIIVIAFFWLHARSRWGAACEAVRQDEEAAAAMGIDVRAVKVMAFGVGAGFTAIGGGFYAHHFFFIDPSTFGFGMSIAIVLFVIFGGVGTFWGPVAGASILTVLPELFRFLKDYYLFAYGLMFVALMIWRPNGLIDRSAVAAVRERVLRR